LHYNAAVLKPRIRGLIGWHRMFAGVYARVAKKMALSPSFVSRVARGERESPDVLRALEEELSRLEKLKPK
jgi:transcriptional regulator with XRE-family HTH domain